LTAKDYKGNNMANHNKLRNQRVDESNNMVTSILFFIELSPGGEHPT
jgi:hypothetical protein